MASPSPFVNPLRAQVLGMYKRLLRLGSRWSAQDPSNTTVERQYITEETKALFRANRGVEDTAKIQLHLREAEARMTMAEHYRNPYPRPVNLPKRSFGPREGKRVGKAIDKINKMSKPIYIKSIDEGKTSSV